MTSHTSILNDPRARSLAFQAALFLALGGLAYVGFVNLSEKLAAKPGLVDLGFWSQLAGFDITQSFIPFAAGVSTYGHVFVVGLLNTLAISAIGIVLATLLGFTVGVARLSGNWLIAKLATVYVESLRNIPLLLQLLFWYNAVLKPLPLPRASLIVPGGGALNNRGLFLPAPVFGPGSGLIFAAAGLAVAVSIAFYLWAKRRQAATGAQAPVALVTLALLIGLPLIAYIISGEPISFDYPKLKGFNYTGGLQFFPEAIALLLGLVLYTAAFIAEIVRAGILSVSKGQSEAAAALGLRATHALRLVVIPQALRVITPPLTSQYLNLTKNSSLGSFIAFPELANVFMGSTLNVTGAAIPIVALTMAVYLVISLITSLIMNIYNARMALVER
jgi:general L-amino acid transport system permease protein